MNDVRPVASKVGRKNPFGETLAGTTLGTGAVAVSDITSRPRYEQFFECGTRLRMSVELHRKLIHPVEVPKVLHEELFSVREKRQHEDYFTLMENSSGSLGKSLRLSEVPGQPMFQTRGSGSFMRPAPAPGSGSGGRLGDTAKGTGTGTGALFGTTTNKYTYPTSSLTSSFQASMECNEELQKRLAITPFTRMIFTFKYDDDDALLAIQDAVNRQVTVVTVVAF